MRWVWGRYGNQGKELQKVWELCQVRLIGIQSNPRDQEKLCRRLRAGRVGRAD